MTSKEILQKLTAGEIDAAEADRLWLESNPPHGEADLLASVTSYNSIMANCRSCAAQVNCYFFNQRGCARRRLARARKVHCSEGRF